MCLIIYKQLFVIEFQQYTLNPTSCGLDLYRLPHTH